jgi:hypothetical protein
VGQDFVVSGVITPASTAKSRAAVKVKLLMEMGDRYGVMDFYVAKLTKMPAGKRGTRYSRTLNIPMKGKHSVRVFQYREGMLVSTSRITHFEVEDGTDVQRISIDSDSHADVNAAAGKPMNVVFHSPSGRMCGRTVQFLSEDFVRVSADPRPTTATACPPAPTPGSAAWKGAASAT